MSEGTAPSVPLVLGGGHDRVDARPAGAPAVSAGRLARLPWRAVGLPWLVSRLLAAFGLCVLGARPFGTLDLDALVDWDTGWFQRIVSVGYGPSQLPTPWRVGAAWWTTWPFFPLHPFLARLVTVVGISDRAALVIVNNLAFLAALAGLHRLARRHLGAPGAAYAVWAMALFPGSVTSVMGYSGGLFAAGLVWAFVLVEERRHAWAGLAMAVATASRPNGFLFLVPLLLMVLVLAARRPDRRAAGVARAGALAAGPSLVFLAAWCAWCRHVTGDALVFLHAKDAWEEVTVGQFLHHPLSGNPTVHVFLAVIATVAVVWEARRLAWPWLVLVVLALLPSFVLGVTGLGRYAGEAFPVFVALALIVQRLPRWMRSAYFASSALGLLAFAVMVHRWRYVP